MDRVPGYWQVYALHSDMYSHLLNQSVSGAPPEGITEATLVDAYASTLEDLEAAGRYAPTARARYFAELDFAFISGNWRGLSGRIDKVLAEPGCEDSNWTSTVVNVIGKAADYLELATEQLACDPLQSLSWYTLARAKLWAGEVDEALRIAREGSQVAPGNWLTMILAQSLIASGLHDEAQLEIENHIQAADMASVFQTMIAAHRGDRDRLDPILAEYLEQYSGGFYDLMVDAWSGRREKANRKAAEIDEHFFGGVVLWSIANWCHCGSPWDLEVTPNFAARIDEANLTWPPETILTYPLKDW